MRVRVRVRVRVGGRVRGFRRTLRVYLEEEGISWDSLHRSDEETLNEHLRIAELEKPWGGSGSL